MPTIGDPPALLGRDIQVRSCPLNLQSPRQSRYRIEAECFALFPWHNACYLASFQYYIAFRRTSWNSHGKRPTSCLLARLNQVVGQFLSSLAFNNILRPSLLVVLLCSRHKLLKLSQHLLPLCGGSHDTFSSGENHSPLFEPNFPVMGQFAVAAVCDHPTVASISDRRFGGQGPPLQKNQTVSLPIFLRFLLRTV